MRQADQLRGTETHAQRPGPYRTKALTRAWCTWLLNVIMGVSFRSRSAEVHPSGTADLFGPSVLLASRCFVLYFHPAAPVV